MEHAVPQTQSPFATEPIGRLIVKFAVPSVIALLVNSLYNIVDQIFIGWGVGYLGNGATNIVFPITIIALALSMMIGNGGAAYLSLKMGEGEVETAKKGVGNAVTLVTIVSILLAVIFLIWIDPILTLFGATDVLRPFALEYGFIIGAGLPFMMISAAINSMIRANGSPKYAMLSMVIGAIINVILDPVFIFVFQMGVKGAAIATIIGQVASFVVSVLYMPHFKSVQLNKSSFAPCAKVSVNIVIFGLSSAHVAATLAAVMVGYNVILGHTPDGEPIRLLSESVLNGTILMILATCTVSTFATQRGAHNIAMRNAQDDDEQPQQEDHILIPVANEQTVSELVSLSTTLKKAKSRNGLYALNAIDNKVEDPTVEKRGRKILDTAAKAAAASDNYLQALLRYDVNIANAIVSVVKERSITDIVMGMHHDRTPGGSGIGRMAADVLGQSNVTTYLYHPAQPLPTIKRHLVVVPEKAEKEAGFQMWIQKLRNIADNSGARIVFYAPESTMQYLRPTRGKRSAKAEYVVSNPWDDLTALTYETKRDDCLWVVMSRRERVSYHPAMSKVPAYMEQFFADNSFVLVYPVQAGDTESRYI